MARRTYPAKFEEFWALYPMKRGGKIGAFLMWQNRVPSHATADEVIAGLRRQVEARSFSDERRFVPHARTWLSQGRWDDEVVPRSTGAGAAAPVRGEYDDLV